jgi:hypothetical protein
MASRVLLACWQRRAMMASGTRPPGRPGNRTRAAKVRAGTCEVATDRRYGGRRHTRRHPNGRNPGDVWSIPRRTLGGPFHDRPASSAFSYSKANSS